MDEGQDILPLAGTISKHLRALMQLFTPEILKEFDEPTAKQKKDWPSLKKQKTTPKFITFLDAFDKLYKVHLMEIYTELYKW